MRRELSRLIAKTINQNDPAFVKSLPSQLHVGKAASKSVQVHLLVNENETSTVKALFNSLPSGIIESVEWSDKPPKNLVLSINSEQFIQNTLTCPINDKRYCHDTQGGTTLVEYSSPNVAKAFHLGHLRSTVVGNYIANLQELNGRVIRLNYLGDWGTQLGSVKVGLSHLEGISVKEDPIKALHNAYVEVNKRPELLAQAKEAFSQIEMGKDTVGLEQWKEIQKVTVEHLKRTYSQLGVEFDHYDFESMYNAAQLHPVLELLSSRNLTIIDDGVTKLDVGGHLVPLIKSDGSSLYLSRDIAAALDRKSRYNFDSMIYVVDKSQSDHMSNLKFTLEKLDESFKVKHVPFGLVTGMSTRKGTGVFLSDILGQAIDKMAEQQKASPNTRSDDPITTEVLGITTLIVYILKQSRMRNFQFNWDTALQGSGDSGVKLQYTHARLLSVEEQCGVTLPSECVPTLLPEETALELVVEIARFEDIVCLSLENFESSVLVRYLFNLCGLTSRALKHLRVKGESKEKAEQRLLLFHTARLTLHQGMKLLGLKPLDRI